MLQDTSSHYTKALFALLVTIILWSSAFVGIRYAVVYVSPASLAFLRYVVASLVMIYPVLKLKKHKVPTIKEIPIFLLLGLLGFTVYNVSINYGEVTVNAGTANFIISQVPLAICLLSIFFFKEKIKTLGWFGFILSISGTLLIVLGENHGEMNIGIIFIYIAVIAMAIYSVLQKKYTTRYHPIEITAYAIWAGTLFLSIYAHQAWHEVLHLGIKQIAVIIYIGVFPGAIAYSLWSYGLKHFPATKAASFLYLMPLFTLFFAWLLLSEQPTIIAIIGGICASIGSLIVNKYGISKLD